MNRVCITLALLAAVSGCAKRPAAIAPTVIPIEAYQSSSCSQIASDLAAERTSLGALEKEQNSAATGDAVGVFLVGVPVSSAIGGDQEGQISVAKGKVLAMESALKAKNCPSG